jgi:hypothetical protein
MLNRFKRTGLTTAALIAAAAAVNAGTAAAAGPATELTPANAAQILPSGYVKQGDDYVYDGGKVIVTPVAAAPAGAAAALLVPGLPCTDGYLCLYRDAGWEGTRWQFADHTWQDLNPYGASDEVSSWSNHESRNAQLGWDSIAQGRAPYLSLAAGSHATSMGSWGDEASSVLP